jgi:plasmid maintenance system antidote protein VapI
MLTDNDGFTRQQKEMRHRLSVICLRYMADHSLTRRQFANLLQIDKRTLNSIITCRGNITLDVFVKIAEVTHHPSLTPYEKDNVQ